MAKPTCKDLFDEVPVTWDDIWLWIERVAGIHRLSWRANHYATSWNIVEKIQRDKQEGHWPPEHSRPHLPYICPHCGKMDVDEKPDVEP